MAASNDDSSSDSMSNSSSSDESPKRHVMTASEMMQRKVQGRKKEPKNKPKEKIVDDDIDDEIKRLEAELAEDSSDSEDSDSDSSSNGGRLKRIRFGESTILNPQDVEVEKSAKSQDQGVICLSECASDFIAPLPKTVLPTNKRKKLKIDSEEDGSRRDDQRRKRTRSNENGSGGFSDGLRDAVKEVLSGYVARSSEKIPFYCRVCLHQSENQEDFTVHKTTEFHKAAVSVEKKATYCKLCRKQLTSIVQMQDHLESRPHRDKMDLVKARQRGNEGFRPTGRGSAERGSFRGRGRGGRGAGRWQGRDGGSGRMGTGRGSNSSRSGDKRQWC